MELNHSLLASLCQRHDVARLRVFGSAARGDDVPESDVDLLVEFTKPKTLIELVGIEHEFEEALGRKVDMLTPASLSPYIRDEVLREARDVYVRPAA
jgi:predicted nucleotidyltransferase